METGFDALKRAVQKFGSHGAAARAIGVSQQAVTRKMNNGGRVPAEWCLPIERATAGEISRHDLRPDLYPEAEAAQ